MTKNAEGPKCGLQYKGETGEIRDDAFHGTTLANALNILKMGFTPHLGIAGVSTPTTKRLMGFILRPGRRCFSERICPDALWRRP